MTVLVHKAVEPDNLSIKGKARLDAMLRSGETIVQPKLDGVYCQIVDGAAYSRTGEPLPSVSHRILEQFGGQTARFMGELWMPDTAHSVINGLARKQSPQESLQLHLFDMFDSANGPHHYIRRYERLVETFTRLDGVHVVPNIAVVLSREPAEAMEYLYELAAKIKAKASAYDGLVLKDRYDTFNPGHGKNGGAIKIKPRSSGDFRVVGCTEGVGNREGGMGAAVVDLGGGVTCEVGSGFTADDVHAKGCGYFKNKIIEVEYLSITNDGRLREPVYKAVRFDKSEPDILACNLPGAD